MSTDTNLTEEQFAELIRDGEPTAPPRPSGMLGHQVCPIPASFYVYRAGTFYRPEPASWAYTQFGIFATGHWGREPDEEKSLLIPYEALVYIEFDMESYKELQGEGPSD